jgi:hypothetical protein
MSRFADPDGSEAWDEGPPLITEEVAATVRDAMVVRLRRRGTPWRAIALILNAAPMTLKDRYDRLDGATRDRYERMPLGL